MKRLSFFIITPSSVTFTLTLAYNCLTSAALGDGVRSAKTIPSHIPSIVIGLTIVAFGTSAPELTVSILKATVMAPLCAMS